MRVLFTTDGSKEATAAMRAGSRLLPTTDREAHVLYVSPELRAPKSGKISRREYQHRSAEATRRILENAKKILTEEGVDALTLCQGGSPAGVIMREAEDYDITVVGAKGGDTRSEVGLGPVASRLVEHASGCVLIGREPPEDRQPRILVPLDGSDGSDQALDALVSFFDIESAEITLLHVLETLWLPTEEEAASTREKDPEATQTDQVALELRREAEQLLNEARARVLPHHSGVTSSIREGIPANEILSEADQGDYDLVVVGATSASDMKHSVLGSVSSKVAWNAPCSVLIVRVPE
jgi:nucleotide-binding universal stress UspA family protein